MKTNEITISIDSTADYMLSEINERGLKCITMAYVVNEKPVYEIFDSKDEFYNFFKKIEDGADFKTTQLNKFETKEYFERILNETTGDIIHYPLSSGLSGTYQCALDAAEEINEKLKEDAILRKIYVVETFGATQTICHLVDYAIKLKKEGKSAEEIVKETKKFRDTQQIFIMVNDLSHLKRGGRISGVSAAIGSLLNIKPILILNDEGKLVVHSKEMGIKKGISAMLSAIKSYGKNIENQMVFVCHTGKAMSEHSDALSEKIKNEFKCETAIRNVGTVIGTHLGPDALIVIFSGKSRLHK